MSINKDQVFYKRRGKESSHSFFFRARQIIHMHDTVSEGKNGITKSIKCNNLSRSCVKR